MDSIGLDKESAINTALANIKAGMLKPDVLAILSNLCPSMSKKTISRYYNAAAELCQDYHSKVHEVISGKEIEIIGQASIGIGVLTKLQRQKILSDIAIGKVTHIKQVATKFGVETIEVWPTWSDRKSAIQELNKMDGAYVSDIDPDEEITEVVIRRITSHGT